MICRLTTALAFASVLFARAPAHADDDHAAPRRWLVLADSMLGARGNEGGRVSVGYRLVLVAGVVTPSIDLFFTLDRQIGDDRRVIDDDGDAALYSEWLMSARGGRRFEIATNLWLVGSAGAALIHERLADVDGGETMARADLAFDAVGALVWHADPIVTNVFGGLTAPLLNERRLEPSAGLGVGLLF